MTKQGIEHITKVLDLTIEAGNVSEKVRASESVMGKIMALMPLTDELLSLMSLSTDALSKEWKDLDAEERETLKEHVRKKFDLEDDSLEAKVEEGLELASAAVNLFERVSSYSKSFKAPK